jgi:DNA-binding sugar fermentation-stimulating protein
MRELKHFYENYENYKNNDKIKNIIIDNFIKLLRNIHELSKYIEIKEVNIFNDNCIYNVIAICISYFN